MICCLRFIKLNVLETRLRIEKQSKLLKKSLVGITSLSIRDGVDGQKEQRTVVYEIGESTRAVALMALSLIS